MQLTSVDTDRSPDTKGMIRITGQVTFRDGSSDALWFDVPERYRDELTISGNTWLSSLLPLVAVLEEPLQICLPVDRLLYENVHELMHIWRCWYRDLRPGSIEADFLDGQAEPARPRIGQFTSTGIDSTFTLLRHHRSVTPDAPFFVDDLLSAGGIEIPLSHKPDLDIRRRRLQRWADEYERELILIDTNVMDFTWRHQLDVPMKEGFGGIPRAKNSWYGAISHAPLMAGVAYILEKRFRKVVISSTYRYRDVNRFPFCSTALTDHLLSTSGTDFFHFGSGFSRAEKAQLVAQSDVAREILHVCWVAGRADNCCECLKCLQTMIALEIAGALERCPQFPVKKLDMSKVEKVFPEAIYSRVFFEELREFAAEKHRSDIVQALDKAFERLDRVKRRTRLGDWLTAKPLLWRLASPVRRATRRLKEGTIQQPLPNMRKRLGLSGGESG
jgi:hypothetical protein